MRNGRLRGTLLAAALAILGGAGMHLFVRRGGAAPVVLAAALSLALAACDSKTGNITLGALGITALGASSASSEIEQIYYVGIFDPQGQLDPQMYRIRVHGQASLLGFTKFASGWVPASVVDSLSSNIGFNDKSNQVTVTPATGSTQDAIQAHRKLIMFGPEGFRESPKDHRLAIAMGSNPEAFFDALNTSLGDATKLLAAKRNDGLMRGLFEELVKLKAESGRLDDFARDLATELPPQPTQLGDGK